MAKLFGTDGIRGTALQPPLDEATVRRLGGALATELRQRCAHPHILLAGDTRASTEILARWLGESFRDAGGELTWGGVLPTPAVSSLLARGSFDAGVVISASHNPASDNGIKVLAANGEKIDDQMEASLEARLESVPPRLGPPLPAVDRELRRRYLDTLLESHDDRRSLTGLELVVDAANGAASGLASELLTSLGARVTAIASTPDGTNINAGCGATAPHALAARVVELGAHGGIALDGDADRAILVDETGSILDGDDILLAWAADLAARDRLPGRRVVATVMSNFGLERALGRLGIQTVRCAVGDRSVWLSMREQGAALGGEQSGHIICAHYGVSGDGLLTGSHLFAIAARSGRPVSALSRIDRMPQVLLNVPVRHKQPFEELPSVSSILRAAESELAGCGRILLRYSGTEPLARVMVEGDEAQRIEMLAEAVAEAIRSALS